ncbi:MULTISPECIES: hypothetical protein [Sorangium]|uniref:hypothetical protein n=1 Tax=Sorangium TaxID=39643 RepID=UPI003D9C204C
MDKDKRAPHPATVVQSKGVSSRPAAAPKHRLPFAGPPPHPATVAQVKRVPVGPRVRPPHPATVAQAKRAALPRPGTVQRMDLEKSTTTTSEIVEARSSSPHTLSALLFGTYNAELFDYVVSFLALEDLGRLSAVCTATRAHIENRRYLEPGSRRIELGAGNMASALAFGLTETLTAFTEYDSFDNLAEKYQGKGGFLHNVAVQGNEKFIIHKNVIAYGIDATAKGPFERLPRTRMLRFTNPNVGSEDVSDLVKKCLDDLLGLYLGGTVQVTFQRFGVWFILDLTRLICETQGKPPNQKKFLTGKKKNAHTANTSYSITSCCNVYLLYHFFANASPKLQTGGCIELIVKEEYRGRWPIELLAKCCGYELVEIVSGYKLGFENIHTQTSEKVGKQTDAKYVYLRFERSTRGNLPSYTVLYETMLQMYATSDTSKTQANLVSGFGLQQPEGIPTFSFEG